MARPPRAWQAIVLLGLLLAVSCTPNEPLATRGKLDLTTWDFSRQPVVKLDGEWDFWWDKSAEPANLSDLPGAETAKVPGFWNAQEASRHPALGAATYRLQLRLPKNGGPWSLGMSELSCAWRLTANGVQVAESGNPSTNPLEYQAHVRVTTVMLPAGANDYDLFLYIVNLSDHVGGIRDSLTVGPTAVLERGQRLGELDAAFFVGGLLVMSLFNLAIFFLQRRKWSNLWLAVFTVFIAVRTLFTGSRIIYELWPALSFETSSQIEYLCIFGAVSAFIVYLKYLFPQWWPARIFLSFLFYTAVFAVLSFLLPIKTYADAVTGFYYLPFLFIVLFSLGVCWWAARKKHEDGPAIFYGMIFLVAGTLNDLLYQFLALPQGYVLGRFLFIFLLFNTFLLSRQISKDFAVTEKQTGELRELDKMKDDFLARVTHELRTPLHGMVGILDAFRMGDFGPLSHRQTYHLGLLEASSKRLLAMVSSILDFSHLRKQQFVPDSKPILLNQTVDFLLPSFYPDLKPGVALINRISEQFPAALGDEVKLEQVLHHLVQNAIKHTETGTITLEAELKDHQILLTVRDTGAGIPSEKLARLFSPFHQVDEIDTRVAGGLGLGLAISRQLVQLMGGTLDLQSQEGVGTTVFLRLPLCPPTKLQYFQAERLDRAIALKPTHFDEPVKVPVIPAQTDGDHTGPTVLIVDDEPVNLLVLRTFLSRIGYSVIEASSGPQALESVSRNVIDLIVLDIMMPGMSGYEVCLKIRERFTPARLPILLLTAKNQVDDLLQGYQCGASDFLTKPFQREELQARMELHLRVSSAARSGMVVANKA